LNTFFGFILIRGRLVRMHRKKNAKLDIIEKNAYFWGQKNA